MTAPAAVRSMRRLHERVLGRSDLSSQGGRTQRTPEPGPGVSAPTNCEEES
jgi:hypothetical protein